LPFTYISNKLTYAIVVTHYILHSKSDRTEKFFHKSVNCKKHACIHKIAAAPQQERDPVPTLHVCQLLHICHCFGAVVVAPQAMAGEE